MISLSNQNLNQLLQHENTPNSKSELPKTNLELAELSIATIITIIYIYNAKIINNWF